VTVAEVLTATVRISAPPADVFPYFTDPALLVQWIGEWADLHPEPGGKFALDFAKTPVRGEYVEVEPPRRVVFTWGVAGKDSLPPGSTTVEIVLTADGPTRSSNCSTTSCPPRNSTATSRDGRPNSTSSCGFAPRRTPGAVAAGGRGRRQAGRRGKRGRAAGPGPRTARAGCSR
jgi:uncharacterized protein YndB with AHSA1/START domain